MTETKRQLCPCCKTGAEALKLDPKEPMCPYMHLYGEDGCSGYVPLNGGDEN